MNPNPSQPFDERVDYIYDKYMQTLPDADPRAEYYMALPLKAMIVQAVAELVEAAMPAKRTNIDPGRHQRFITAQQRENRGFNVAIDQYHANLLAGLTGGDRKWTRKLEKSTMEEVDTYLAILKAPQRKRQ